MIVVPVLITSCQVSEKPNIGPVTAQTTTIRTATMNVEARPAASEVRFAASPKNFLNLDPCPSGAEAGIHYLLADCARTARARLTVPTKRYQIGNVPESGLHVLA